MDPEAAASRRPPGEEPAGVTRGSTVADPEDPRLAFVLELGRALHAYGDPSHQLEETLVHVARRLGVEGQFFTLPTSIFVAFGARDRQRTFLMRVEPGDVQLAKLTALEAVAADVADGRLDPRAGAARVEAIRAAPAPYGGALTLLTAGVTSAAAARLLGGGAREVVVAAAIGVAVALVALAFTRRTAARRVFEPLAAGVGAWIAAALAGVLGPTSIVATLAGLIALIPGLTLATAMIELSARHLMSGTARLAGALVVFVGIAVGTAMGGRLAELSFGPAAASSPVPLPPWTEWAALAFAPLGLIVLLRAPLRELGWVVATCVLAVLGSRLGSGVLGPELGIFAGALAAGVASNLYERLRGRPALVTLVPALLLLVPGSVGIRGLAELFDREVLVGVESAFRAAIMFSALAAGVLLANVLVSARPAADP